MTLSIKSTPDQLAGVLTESQVQDRAGKTLEERRSHAIVSIIVAGRAGQLDHHFGPGIGDADVLFDLAAHWADEQSVLEDACDTALAVLEDEGRTWSEWA